MKTILKLLVLSGTLAFSLPAQAVLFDLGLTQFTQSFTQAQESKTSQTFVSTSLLADLSRGETRWCFGWSVLSVATKVESSTGGEEKFSSMDMGPALRWFMDNKRMYSLTLVYAVYAKGKYELAGSSENLTGNSLFVKFSIEPQIGESVNLGVSLNYYNPTYSKSVLNSSESDVSYKGTQIFPSLSMSYKF